MQGSPAAIHSGMRRRARLRVAAIGCGVVGVLLGGVGLWVEESVFLLLGLLVCGLIVPAALMAQSAASAGHSFKAPPGVVVATVCGVGWLVYAGVLTAAISWLSLGGDPTKFIFMGTVAGCVAMGASLIRSGWPRRVGDGLHCARCDYTCAERDIDLRPLQCPECMHYWGYDVRRGKRFVRFGFMVCGGMIALVAFLGPNLGLIGGMTRLVPTWALLISERSGGGDRLLYQALAKRALTSAEQDAVIDRVLRRFAVDPREPGMAFIEALNRAVPVTRLGPQVRDRIFEVGFPVRIIAPRKLETEKPIALRLVTTSGGPPDLLAAVPNPNVNASYLSAGIFLDGVWAEPVDVFGEVVKAGEAASVTSDAGRGKNVTWWYQAWEPFGGESPLAATLTFEKPGKYLVNMRYWIMIAPNQEASSVSWRDDGVPDFRPPTYRFERRTAKLVVTVE